MLVLVIDTSEAVCSLILARDRVVISVRDWEATKDTGRSVLKRLDEILAESEVTKKEIDRIAVCHGPSRRYSSLRAGITLAAILAMAWGIELVEVRSSKIDKMVAQAVAARPKKVVEPIYDNSVRIA